MNHGHILPACTQHQSVSPLSKFNFLKTVLSEKKSVCVCVCVYLFSWSFLTS